MRFRSKRVARSCGRNPAGVILRVIMWRNNVAQATGGRNNVAQALLPVPE